MLLFPACSSGDYRSGPPPPPTTTTLAPEVTIRGVVGGYSTSARILTLAPPVDGVASVVVPTDAEVVRAGGTRATVSDIAPRAAVEVTGRPGAEAGTFIARRIVLP